MSFRWKVTNLKKFNDMVPECFSHHALETLEQVFSLLPGSLSKNECFPYATAMY